ncbi:PWWP domain-containing DNA repair factor 3A isoform X2 [Amia ocellicauda]|uniref:PWWP domain-containing DNA repair factor 3A isoform X2 n=1 Tax=Amia ocellicauda TaxID=2972642 RepID=UPI003464A781
MDEPLYMFCKWEGRLWPAKLIRKAAQHSKKKNEIEVEIFNVGKRIWVKQEETVPLTEQRIEIISLQLDLDSKRQHIVRIFLEDDDSEEEFLGFPTDCNQTAHEPATQEMDSIKELRYRKALRLALNVLSGEVVHSSSPSGPGAGRRQSCRLNRAQSRSPLQSPLGATAQPKAKDQPQKDTFVKKTEPQRVLRSQTESTSRSVPNQPEKGDFSHGGVQLRDGHTKSTEPQKSSLRSQVESPKCQSPQSGRPSGKRKSSGKWSPLSTRENGCLRPSGKTDSADVEYSTDGPRPRKRGRPLKVSTVTELDVERNVVDEKRPAKARLKSASNDPSPHKETVQRQLSPETLSPRSRKGRPSTLQNGQTSPCASSPSDTDCNSGQSKRGRGRPRLHKPLLSSTPISSSKPEPHTRDPRQPPEISRVGTPRREEVKKVRRLFEHNTAKQQDSVPEKEQGSNKAARRGRHKKIQAAASPVEQEIGSVSPRTLKRGRPKKSCPEPNGRKYPEQSAPLTQGPADSPLSTRVHPRLELHDETEVLDELTKSSDLSIELSLHNEASIPNISEEEEEDDDEEELPSFFLQMEKKPLSIREGICVWCKFRSYPYWPAMVKSVNHKNKKASIIFIDDLLFDKKTVRKGLFRFCVSLRTLKPFDCEETDEFVIKAQEKYKTAINWCLELIRDYRIRIACGSFSGSFIEYFANDISCPVRKMYLQGSTSVPFPSKLIREEQEEVSDTQVDSSPSCHGRCKKLLPDRSKAARTRANEKLVEFIIKNRGAERHLQAIISGRTPSKWLKEFLKFSRFVTCVETYLEDEAQLDLVYNYLKSIYDSAPQTAPCLADVDSIRFILDVLLPEAIICAIATVDKISLEKAEDKYLKGPVLSKREREEFDMQIEKEMKMKALSLNIQGTL